MGTETTHTPTLWALFSDKPTHEWQERTIIKEATGKIIAETTDIQDAAFIVNSYNKLAQDKANLIAALDRMLTSHYNLYKKVFGEHNPDNDLVRKYATEVLALATEEVTHDA